MLLLCCFEMSVLCCLQGCWTQNSEDCPVETSVSPISLLYLEEYQLYGASISLGAQLESEQIIASKTTALTIMGILPRTHCEETTFSKSMEIIVCVLKLSCVWLYRPCLTLFQWFVDLFLISSWPWILRVGILFIILIQFLYITWFKEALYTCLLNDKFNEWK